MDEKRYLIELSELELELAHKAVLKHLAEKKAQHIAKGEMWDNSPLNYQIRIYHRPEDPPDLLFTRRYIVLNAIQGSKNEYLIDHWDIR